MIDSIASLATLLVLSFTIVISVCSLFIFGISFNLLDDQKRQKFVLLACSVTSILVLIQLFADSFVLELTANLFIVLVFLATWHDCVVKFNYFYGMGNSSSMDRISIEKIFIFLYGFFPALSILASLAFLLYSKDKYLIRIQGFFFTITVVALVVADIWTIRKILSLLKPLKIIKPGYKITNSLKMFKLQARVLLLVYPLIWILIFLDITNRIFGILTVINVTQIGYLVSMLSLSIVHTLIRALLHLTFGLDLDELFALHQPYEVVVPIDRVVPEPRPSGLSRKSFEEYALGLVRQETVKKIFSSDELVEESSINSGRNEPVIAVVEKNSNLVLRQSTSARTDLLDYYGRDSRSSFAKSMDVSRS